MSTITTTKTTIENKMSVEDAISLLVSQGYKVEKVQCCGIEKNLTCDCSKSDQCTMCCTCDGDCKCKDTSQCWTTWTCTDCKRQVISETFYNEICTFSTAQKPYCKGSCCNAPNYTSCGCY